MSNSVPSAVLHEGHPPPRAHETSAVRSAPGASSAKTRDRLRVLFVTPYLPSPPRFGGQQRLHGLISGLARHHDVSLVSMVDPGQSEADSRAATERYCTRVLTLPNARHAAQGAYKRVLQLRSLFTPRSHAWLVHRGAGVESTIDDLISRERFDIVHFSFAQMAFCGLGKRPRRAPGGPAFCLDEHNIEYDVLRRTADAGDSPARRLYNALDWRKLQTEERRAWTSFDGCTVTSDRDERFVRAEAPATPTCVVPNGVDLDHLVPELDAGPPRPQTLLFFGAIDYYPNTHGLLFFLREVMPKLLLRHPAIRLSIVGRKPPESILAHRSPNVEVLGVVDDLRPHIARATAVVAPLFIGGGTRLKVLEAMAMAKPVVSTALGVEGLDVVAGRHVLVADEADAFAAEITRLLEAPALGRALGDAARELVVARYGWGASVERLDGFYEGVLRARGRV